MEVHVRIESQSAGSLLAVRRVAPLHELPTVIRAACGAVWDLVRANKIEGAGRNMSVFWDDRLTMDIGVEYAGSVSPVPELTLATTPAGRIATATHLGPYEQLKAFHHATRQWCQDKGYTLAGPNWEIYGHWLPEWDSNPAAIRTDVYYLLTP